MEPDLLILLLAQKYTTVEILNLWLEMDIVLYLVNLVTDDLGQNWITGV